MTLPGARCAACVNGPQGIRGHPRLYVLENAAGNAAPIFRCEDCGHRYDRLYAGGGLFIWTRIVGPKS